MKLFLLLSSLLVLASCEDIKIGLLASEQSLQGYRQIQAAEAAVSNVNSNFRRSGSSYRVRLTVYDTLGHQPGAVAAIKAAADDGLTIVVGPFTSPEVLAVIKIAERKGITVISPTATSTTLSSDNLLLMSMSDVAQASSVAAQMRRDNVNCLTTVTQKGNAAARQLASLVEDFFTSTRDSLGNYGKVVNSLQYKTKNPGKIKESLLAGMSEKNCMQGVFVAGGDSITPMLEDLQKDASMDKVKEALWFTSDSFATSRSISASVGASNFAAKTGLTGFIYSGDDVDTDFEADLLAGLKADVGDISPSVLLTWDAIHLIGDMRVAGRALASGEWVGPLRAVAPVTNGLTGNLALGEDGFRTFGAYSGYEFRKTSGIAQWNKAMISSYDGPNGRPCFSDNNRFENIPLRFGHSTNKKYCLHSLDYPLMANLPRSKTLAMPLPKDRFEHKIASFELCDGVCQDSCDFVENTCEGCRPFTVEVNSEEASLSTTVVRVESSDPKKRGQGNDVLSANIFPPANPSSGLAQAHEIIIVGGTPELESVYTVKRTVRATGTTSVTYCDANEGSCFNGISLPEFRDLCPIQ